MPLSAPIDSFRSPWENDLSWGLRKEFLLKHQDTLPEDRLSCRAQIYINVVLFDIIYPKIIMDQIHEYAKDLEKGQALLRSKEGQDIDYIYLGFMHK